MIDQVDIVPLKPDGFVVDAAVAAWVDNSSFAPRIHGGLEFKSLPWRLVLSNIALRQYQTVVRIDYCAVLLTCEVRSGDPVIEFTLYPVYSDLKSSEPRWLRKPLTFQAHGDDVEVALDFQFGRDYVLHGQGVTVQAIKVDCRTGNAIRMGSVFPRMTSDYAKADMTQTGGDWPYMGLDFPFFSLGEARTHFYAFGNYPGTFVGTDGMIGEAVFPNDVLHGGTHFHKDGAGEHHIKYSDRGAPWKDRAGETIDGQRYYSPDDQHLCYAALAQALIQHPTDPGLRVLVEAAARRITMQIPGRHKGPMSDRPGTSRARGRILLSCVWLWRGLKAAESAGYTELRNLATEIAQRGAERFRVQVEEWIDDASGGREPWPHFETGGFSVAEAGIWYWGLDSMLDLLEDVGAHPPAELTHMMRSLSKFCFDGFRFTHGIGWFVPYEWFPRDEPRTRLGSGSHDHFAWLAAVNHKDHDDPAKMAAIYAERKNIPERFLGERSTGVHGAL